MYAWSGMGMSMSMRVRVCALYISQIQIFMSVICGRTLKQMSYCIA